MDVDGAPTSGPSTVGVVSWRKGQGFRPWETDLLRNPEVRRKADMAQLCAFARASALTETEVFLEQYFDLLSYIGGRRARLQLFKDDVRSRAVRRWVWSHEDCASAGARHRERYVCDHETQLTASTGQRPGARVRVVELLRSGARAAAQATDEAARRGVPHHHAGAPTSLVMSLTTQVGQGGYGEVYLARKRDTGEICALKKMRKRTLAKMDEVRSRPASHP